MTNRARLCRSLVCLMAVSLAATGLAQTSKVGATLQGRVADTTGAPVSGAEVRLRSTETNQLRALKTDGRGSFSASELTVGTYEVRVEQPGFAPYQHTGVELSVGQRISLNIELVPAALQQEVTVTAQPPSISPSETTFTTTVDHERIEESPVRTRNLLDFVLLAPGVTGANPQQAGGTQTPLAGSGFTFGGLRARSNTVSIDGLDNNDEFTGASRTELSPEIVREFRVVNNGLSAEFGGAAGGSINVVTKSGSNTFHGDDFIFVRNGIFDAKEPFETEANEHVEPQVNRYRLGSSLGGPLRKDRTFFYEAIEQESEREEGISRIQPAVVSVINNLLHAGAWPGTGTQHITDGTFPEASSETEASGKLDHHFSDRHSLMLRYAYTNNRISGDAFNTGALSDASARGNAFTKDQGLAGSLASVASARTVNDLRFQFATRRVTLRTDDETGPGIDISGLVSFGRPYQGNSRRRENHEEVSDSVARLRGAHLIKAGLTASHVSLVGSTPDGFGGVYVFPSLAAFRSGQPDSFRQAFGSPATRLGVTSYGFFVQDHWSARRRLAVDLGARYDFERLPAGFNQDTNDISPRLGLAFSPSSAWVLRAGFGIFYDRYALASLNRAVEKDGVNAFEAVAEGDAAANIFKQAEGGSLQTPVPLIGRSIFRVDRPLATSYSAQTSFGVEHLLAPDLSISANYLYVRGVKLPRTRNINLLEPVALTAENAAALGIADFSAQQIGREVFGPGRLDPDFNDIDELEGSSSSTYHGLSIALNRRLSHEVEFSAAYTLSRTMDDASDFDEQPQDPYDLIDERGLSRNHQAHRFVFSGTFDLPFGEEEEDAGHTTSRGPGTRILNGLVGHIEMAPIITLSSGRPVNPLTGVDSNRTGAFPLSSRPLGFVRNSLGTPSLATIDLRVVKYFPLSGVRRLDFVVESFNLFNRTNVREINPFYGSGASPLPGFAEPLDAFNPRQLQFSIDFEF